MKYMRHDANTPILILNAHLRAPATKHPGSDSMRNAVERASCMSPIIMHCRRESRIRVRTRTGTFFKPQVPL